MSIPIIDTLRPLGNFPTAEAKDIDVNGTRLDNVLNIKANASDISALTADKADKSYVDTQLATKASTSSVSSKLDKSVFDSAFTIIG